MSRQELGRDEREGRNSLPVTIREHLRNEQALHPAELTGAITSILEDMSLVAKSVSSLVNRAGLTDTHGAIDRTNSRAEIVTKLDDMTNEQFKQVLGSNEHMAGYTGEEEVSFVDFQGANREYIACLDPLDGSSNYGTNISIGSIFGISKRGSAPQGPVEKADFLQEGSKQVCAGYFLYGTSTMFVYTAGEGVYSFTLDPSIGEFVLPEGSSRIQIPEVGKTYSINEGYSPRWTPEVAAYIQYLKTREEDPCSSRYVGSLVADFHRNLLQGGVYLYPRDSAHPDGKLGMIYELNPLAFLVEQAGGMASDGVTRILDKKPQSIHEKSPVAIGSSQEVRLFEQYLHNSSTD